MELNRPDGDAAAALREGGCVLLPPSLLSQLCDVSPEQLHAFLPFWDALPRDAYLLDGGSYRFRRHGCFIQEAGALRQVEHRAHWQPTEYNALHGGMERWFEPINSQLIDLPGWSAVLNGLATLFSQVQPVSRWYIEAHQFRIDTAEGIGRPTPEGAHRDGVDFVAVVLVRRGEVLGGETRVFEAEGIHGVRFTMSESWSALLLDDARVIHETTPVRNAGEQGMRDTLVLTFRKQGFQAPE